NSPSIPKAFFSKQLSHLNHFKSSIKSNHHFIEFSKYINCTNSTFSKLSSFLHFFAFDNQHCSLFPLTKKVQDQLDIIHILILQDEKYLFVVYEQNHQMVLQQTRSYLKNN